MELLARIQSAEDLDAAVEYCYAQRWTDGLPVIPATRPPVERALAYLGRDPQEVVGEIARSSIGSARCLETLAGRKVGFVFNQHVSALAFWEAFEKAVEEAHAPAQVHRIYKPAHSVTAPLADLQRLALRTDYAVVGVGA